MIIMQLYPANDCVPAFSFTHFYTLKPDKVEVFILKIGEIILKTKKSEKDKHKQQRKKALRWKRGRN